MDFKSGLDLILALAAAAGIVAGIVYRISQVEKEIYKTIDNRNNPIEKQFFNLEKRFEIHLQDVINRRDMVTLNLKQLDEKIDHKFNRLANNQRDIQQFLESRGDFRIRNQNNLYPPKEDN